MNQLDELLRSTLDERAQDAPPPARVIGRVLENEPRRRDRTGWLAAAAVATAAATVVAIGATQLGGEDGAPDRGTGPAAAFTERQVTYAEGSTIHYGDQTIDVAPHKVAALVPTDDGFVFVDNHFEESGAAVYLADGNGVEQIGQTSGFVGDRVLASDDTGSYVGWIDGGDVVVYDTAAGTEVLRKPAPRGEVPGSAVAVDDSHAYVSTGNAVEVWDIDAQNKTNFTRPGSYDEISDAANGYLLWDSGVLSRDVEATEPVLRQFAGFSESHLSPDASYVALTTVYDWKRQQDVTPDTTYGVIIQWLDDDRYVADTDNILTSPEPGPHDLLTCSVSAGSCQKAVESLRAIIYPNGIAPESAWQG